MTDGSFWLFLIFVFFLLMAATVGLALYFRRFNEDMKYICREMDNSDSDDEYRYWRRELCCHYLTLIPFVGEKNTIFVYNFLHRGDHSQKEERADSVLHLLMPSVLGLSACVICMIGMTWAWFTANAKTSSSEIKTASYSVTVMSVSYEGNDVPSVGGVYTLYAGTQYNVTLKAEGTAANGYCLIKSGDNEYYSPQIPVSDQQSFTFTPEQDGAYSFTGVWGILPNTADSNKILSIYNDIEEANEDAPRTAAFDDGYYTVQSGDTLTVIAEMYGTTSEILAQYNNIDDPDSISEGQLIEIPPQDWSPADETQTEQTEVTEQTEQTEQTQQTDENAKAVPEELPLLHNMVSCCL